MPTLTHEQQAILEAGRDPTFGNLLIEARAGSGKTFSLMKLLSLLKGTSALTAFNKAIATELKQKAESLSSAAKLNTSIGTAHSFGLGIYRKGSGIHSPKVSGGKVSFMLSDWLDARPRDQQYFRKGKYLVKNLVSHAKNAGFGLVDSPEHFPAIDDEEAWTSLAEHFNLDLELDSAGIALDRAIELAQLTLLESNRRTAQVDFDDMIYLPLLMNLQPIRYDNVLIDEAQDISATRRELCFRMLKPDGRLIAVGDRHQAIYGFTGADAASLSNIGRRANATTLPLTICWRCDAEIIAEAQKIVPDIVARPNAPSGSVSRINVKTIDRFLTGTLRPDEQVDKDLIPRAGDAILCRLNRPNVTMALTLLRAGLPARIEGRDLGNKLLGYVKSADPLYASRDLHTLLLAVEDFGQQQEARLLAAERFSAADLFIDEVACAVVLLERTIQQGGQRFADLEALVNSLFADDIPPGKTITLSSVHKAKGREWPRVFILGRGDYMPFWRAEAEWEKEQEQNLIYVAITRAERELIYITDVKSWLDNRKEQ